MYCPTCRSDYPNDWKACPKDATALLTSAQIGNYNIEGILGVGGMGAVYRATNPDTGSAVAVKVMNREVAESADATSDYQARPSGSTRREVATAGSSPGATMHRSAHARHPE